VGFSYDVSTNRGTVRLLINDVDETKPIFDDTEIDRFLALEDDNVRLAAAKALETIAANEVYVQKVLRLLDRQTDGAKVAAELRANAQTLRDEVDDDTDFDIAPQVHSHFAARDLLTKQALDGE
jgi:hypothetical protein